VALVLLLVWSVVAVAAGAPPVPGLLVLLLFLGHRRRGSGPPGSGRF
jgi:MYXO-CTERM domain-containing protein